MEGGARHIDQMRLLALSAAFGCLGIELRAFSNNRALALFGHRGTRVLRHRASAPEHLKCLVFVSPLLVRRFASLDPTELR